MSPLPILAYYHRDRTISHTQVIRMNPFAAPSDLMDPYGVCTTAVPAVMCACGRFFLERRPRPRVKLNA